MMKAMVLTRTADVGTAPLQLRELPMPEPGPGEVLVCITVCGICRTDLHVIEGELANPTLPLVPGHQAVGIVSQVGAGVTERSVGERVGIAWLQYTCGLCEFCTSGRENLCESARFTGYQVDGGYAEYALVPAAFAYPIPPVFSDEEAAPLLCAGIIGYRALRLSGIQPGQRLGLYGFGASAHIAIQIARHWGCQVYVSSLKPEHQRLARELGRRMGRRSDGQAAGQAPQLDYLCAGRGIGPSGLAFIGTRRHPRPRRYSHDADSLARLRSRSFWRASHSKRYGQYEAGWPRSAARGCCDSHQTSHGSLSI